MPLPEYLSSNETKEREHCVDTSYVQRGDLDEEPSCKREVASPLHDLEDERKEDNVVGGEESENGSNTSEPSALESVEMADVSAAEKDNKTETFERQLNNRRSKRESSFQNGNQPMYYKILHVSLLLLEVHRDQWKKSRLLNPYFGLAQSLMKAFSAI